MSKSLNLLTKDEQAVYQSLVARGVGHYEAIESVLDGVEISTVRETFEGEN